MEIKEISEVKVDSEIYPIKLAEDQVFGYHEVADKIRKNAAAAASLEKQLDVYNDMWYDESLYGKTIEDKYSMRKTANGANIVNESKAIVKKIEGETVASKNLIPYPYSQSPGAGKFVTILGITYYDNGDGTITINGTASATENSRFTLKNYSNNDIDLGTCTLSTGNPNSNENTYGIQILASGHIVAPNKTVNIRKEDGRYDIIVKAGVKVEWQTIKPMLNKGDIALPFEPYIIDSYVNSKISTIKSSGKNLCAPLSKRVKRPLSEDISGTPCSRKWDGNSYRMRLSRSNYYHGDNANNYIKIQDNKVIARTESMWYGIAFDVPCQPETNYYISLKSDMENSIYTGCTYYDAHGTHLGGGTDAIGTKCLTTSPKNAKWLVVTVHPIYDLQNKDFSFEDVQVIESSILTDYEPYQDSILSLPNSIDLAKWDYVDFESKKIVKQSHTYSFTGTEAFSLNTQASGSNWGNVYMISFGALGLPVAENGQCICSHFPTGRWADDFMNGKTNFCTVTSAVILFKTDGEQDLDSFKSFLASQAANKTPVTLHWKVSESNKIYTMLDINTNEYTVWQNGSEQIINESEVYGVLPTITQDYLIVKQEENNQ